MCSPYGAIAVSNSYRIPVCYVDWLSKECPCSHVLGAFTVVEIRQFSTMSFPHTGCPVLYGSVSSLHLRGKGAWSVVDTDFLEWELVVRS